MNAFPFLGHFNHLFTLLVIFPAVIALGIYLSVRLRFIQLTSLKKSVLCMTSQQTNAEGNISPFRATCSVLAGNLGTGNISGMAIAIATGGPGALIWMWIMVVAGSVIQFVSCVLGASYRKKQSSGEFVGGPMYYLQHGLGYKKIALVYSTLVVFGAIAIGNFAQINSVVLPLGQLGFDPLYCSIVIAFFVGLVILGGIERISHLASIVVPFKAILYLGTALTIIALHPDAVLPSLKLMFQEAFGLSAAAGGIAGATVLKAISTGFDRGLFATDAGLGIVPILQGSAKSEHPVMDGIASLVAPLVVMIVCTATAMVLLITGAWQEPHLQSTNMVTHAFSKGLGHPIGGYIVIVALVLFAFTTIMAWCYCGEKALTHLTGKEYVRWFRLLYIGLIPAGSLLQVDSIWILADVSVSLMLAINLIGIIGLAPQAIVSARTFRASP
jgi:AGCS family alanine or glycine:cation symporter